MKEVQIEQLITKYTKLVYKICLDMLENIQDAEELTQETFLSTFIHLERYKNLPENELRNVICKIALNKCKDFFRSKETKIHRITDELLEELSYEVDIEGAIIKKEKLLRISQMINGLKSPYRDVLNDFYIKNMNIEEIAKEKKVESSTIKVQLYRAREKIKEKILKEGGENL